MPDENIRFIFEKVQYFLSFLWYCCVLTGDTVYEKYNK